MVNWNRRSVLATGATFAAGGMAASSGAAKSESDEVESDDLPDSDIDPNPEMDEDWASYRSDAGRTGFVGDGYEFDGESLEAAWSVYHDDRRPRYRGRVAIADDTVYTTTADGVVALDAEDGSVVWENTDVDVTNPVVTGETVYLTGEEIVALDRSDGSVRWETDVGSEGTVSRHTVAYDTVYVVIDGTLYAFKTDDGSIRWEIGSVTTEFEDGETQAYEFDRSPAAANGVVYAATQQTVLALEPETGDVVWRNDEEWYSDMTAPIHANSTAVVVDWLTSVEKGVYDPYTGEKKSVITSETGYYMALGEELYFTNTDYSFGGGSIESDEYSWGVSTSYNAGQPVISGNTVYVYFADADSDQADYVEALVAFDKYDGTERWALSKDDAPVGHVRAISGETIYVDHDGELVALREQSDDGDGRTGGTVDRPADTRVTEGQTGPSGVRIAVDEDLAGLELTISEQTAGVDTAEIADAVGNPLATRDISGLGPGDTFQIEHDLRAGEEYLVLVHADDAYDRGAYNEEPAWPYDGDEFQVVEGIWARDQSSTANFYAYTTLTALLDSDGGGDDPGDGDGTVDRPTDTRLTPDTTTPSGVRIETQEALSGLELTISENTTGADTAEIANSLGETLAAKDISGLGPGDTFQIEHNLRAGEEYIVLIDADSAYDRGAYNEEPAWPYDGGSFQVLEGIWARDQSSTANFYAYTTLTAIPGDGGDGGNGGGDGTVDRPTDTRLTPDTTTPSGVRIEATEDLAGLELTISENTTGADTAEIANSLGETLATTDISGLGPGDTFQIEHDLAAGEEYIVLIGADGSYDRGAYNDDPAWPYDGGSFQVLEGIWARDRSSTANFYAYTTLTALQ